MMHALLRVLRRRWLELALFASVVHLYCLTDTSATESRTGGAQSQRNKDFPSTYISRIHLDLTNPSHVTLTWTGPDARGQSVGPFRCSTGTGWGTNDCNDAVESNCPDSHCTPKGVRIVEGFAAHLKDAVDDRYLTFIDRRRSIGFHYHPFVPAYPDSQGCVRLEPYAARLIHDNSIKGVTEILIDGTWTPPQAARAVERQTGKAAGEESRRRSEH